MSKPRISFGPTSNNDLPMAPLRLIAIGDFAPSDRPADSEWRLRRIDKDSFNQVLNAVCPSLRLEIPDHTRPDLAPTLVEIPMRDLKSFHPASLIKNLELLRPLEQRRQAILDHRDRRIDREQFLQLVKTIPELQFSEQATPQRPTVSPAPAKVGRTQDDRTDTIDSILDMVAAGGSETRKGATEGAARVQQFISEMFVDQQGARALDPRTANAWLAQVDGYLSKKVAEILSNPEFRLKEKAWRGLKFLVDRTDFREPIQLEMLPADKEHLVQVLEKLVEESEVVGPPVAAIVTDFEFDASTPDMEILRRASELVEQLQAALLVNLESPFFGRECAAEVSAISHLQSHLEAAEYVKWRSLREAESSR